MDSGIEKSLEISSEYLPENVFQNCLRKNYFIAPISMINQFKREVIILIDTTQKMPERFEEFAQHCIIVYEQLAKIEPINNYLH